MKVKILSNSHGNNSASRKDHPNSNSGQPCQMLTGKGLNYPCLETAQVTVDGCKLCRLHAGEKLVRYYTDPKNWPAEERPKTNHTAFGNWATNLKKHERLG